MIPAGLVDRLALSHGAKSRKFSATSHVVAHIYGQLTGCGSLNGICDAARLHASEWSSVRGAAPPCRNTFSNANRTRPAVLAEELYWEVFEHLAEICPGFGEYKRHQGFLFRLKRRVFAIDSSTIKLVLNSFDWAKHRRRKAAAKLHMNLDVGTRLPAFAIVEDAAHHDSVRAAALTEGLRDGDVCVADRAYTDFTFLNELDKAGAFFVVRLKRNIQMKVARHLGAPDGNPTKEAKTVVLADDEAQPAKAATAKKYEGRLRMVRARVEVDGKMTEMTFLTNNFDWSPRTVAELYRARWAVELFFKELKQTCQIHDFVGYNENAVKWQIWIGLLVHLLLRFLKHVAKWGLSFSRLAGVVRAAAWVRRYLPDILDLYGTASVQSRCVVAQRSPYIQGFLEFTNFPVG